MQQQKLMKMRTKLRNRPKTKPAQNPQPEQIPEIIVTKAPRRINRNKPEKDLWGEGPSKPSSKKRRKEIKLEIDFPRTRIRNIKQDRSEPGQKEGNLRERLEKPGQKEGNLRSLEKRCIVPLSLGRYQRGESCGVRERRRGRGKFHLIKEQHLSKHD